MENVSSSGGLPLVPSLSGLDPAFAALVNAPPPPPGERKKTGTGPGHSLVEIATAIAVQVIRHKGSEAVSLVDLMAPTNASKLHKRLNAVGDACGAKHLKFDRIEGGLVPMSHANKVRAAQHLVKHPIASANVADYYDDMKEGEDLLAYIGAKSKPVDEAGTAVPA